MKFDLVSPAILCAINQIGIRIVNAHLPMFGLAMSIMPHITLRIPEINASVGPNPVKRDTLA